MKHCSNNEDKQKYTIIAAWIQSKNLSIKKSIRIFLKLFYLFNQIIMLIVLIVIIIRAIKWKKLNKVWLLDRNTFNLN